MDGIWREIGDDAPTWGAFAKSAKVWRRQADGLSITDLARALEVGRPSRPVTARMPKRAP